MKYRGQIKNGVVVLDEWPGLEDGTVVEVEVADPTERRSDRAPEPRRGTAQAILGADLKWAGPVEELDRLLAEVQRMREEDMELDAEPEPGE